MEVALHIEKLVLPAVSLTARRHIVSALEQELLRLLREEGVPPELKAEQGTHSLDASRITIAKDAKPDVIGRALAQAIYTDLRREQN
ncbi:MAG: hypothetical protein U0350_11145 [Caldilineaceae bacterium]